MKLLITIILVFACQSCVESVTIAGKYADYTISPKKPVIIESAK